MKKYLVLSSIGVLGVIAVLFVVFYGSNSTVMLSSKSNNPVLRTNAITMMYETGTNTGEYQVSGDSTWPQEGYTFNEELSKCENGSILTWNEESKQVLLEANKTDKCYVYFDKEPDIIYFADYIKGLYTSDGENGIYYHDGSGTYGSQEAGDNSYRYAGANPNNYVCFGTDASTCPNDNLYRIIGVFNGQVKLIKHDYAGSDLLGTDGDFYNASYTGTFGESSYYKGSKDQSTIPIYYWNKNTSTNTWSESNLNKINLNTNYLNNIGSKWSNMIATHTWKVGGNTWENIRTATPKTAYTNEIVSPVESTTHNAKVGLMYVSDYGYAASPENWQTNLNEYNNDTNRNNNWMYMGLYEWTISRNSANTNIAFLVSGAGDVNNAYVSYYYGVRPSFYLGSWTLYSGGDGTKDNPYKITDVDIIITLSYNGAAKNYPAKQGMTWKEWFDYVDSSDIGGGCNAGVCSAVFHDIKEGFLSVSEDDIVSDKVLRNQSGGVIN